MRNTKNNKELKIKDFIIEDNALKRYTGDESIVTIPNVSRICFGAFYSCLNVKKIIIPNTVKEIDVGAFYECFSLESVVIPSSVTNIKGRIFIFCDSLKEVIVDKENPVYDSRDNCNAIIETKTNALISACSNSFIPNSIESINQMSFGESELLKEITIPSSVTKIEDEALTYCINLRKVEILCKKILDLGKDVLLGCFNLESLTISCFKEFEISDSGKSKYHIGSLFSESEYPNSYRIHYLLSKDKNKTFYLPNSLKHVILKDMKSVPFVSFFGCDSITHIELSSSIERIENGAFACCTGLVDITYNGTMSEWNAIEKEDYWDDRTGDYSIHCLDGDIKK